MSNKTKSIVSPFGIARWINVNKPDTTFSQNGSYSVRLAVPTDEAEEFIKIIQNIFNAERDNVLNTVPAHKRKTVTIRMPFETEIDDEGNTTGYVIFKFKANASFKHKTTQDTIHVTIPIVGPDAKPTDQIVFNRSIVRVSCVPIVYYVAAMNAMGVSLRLRAVQVKQFAEPPATSMFDAVETTEDEGTSDEKAPWDF